METSTSKINLTVYLLNFCFCRILSCCVLLTLLLGSCQGLINFAFFFSFELLPSVCNSFFPNNFLFYFSRMPQLFTKDIALVQQFFESMCKVGEHSFIWHWMQWKFKTFQQLYLIYVNFKHMFLSKMLFKKRLVILFRRSRMSVLQFRKLCQWWLERMLIFKEHCWI